MNRKIKLIFILYCLRFTLTLHPYFSISIYNIERMRKLFLLTIALCCVMVGLNTGCTDKKPEALTDTLAIDTDTIADTTHADTIARIVEETPMPKAADQLFDDFFFNFIANRRLQRARIVFPLPVTRGGKTKMLQKSQWKTEHFFMRQQYYTLIFDNEQQMDNAKSTSLDSVVVEKIYLREGLVDQYAFGHGDGKWRMERINQISFKDNVNASFLNFLQKFFAANGAGMIRNPLPYSGPDPNGEETSHVETTIPAEEWSTFLPTVPDNMIYNILYGQKYGKEEISVDEIAPIKPSFTIKDYATGKYIPIVKSLLVYDESGKAVGTSFTPNKNGVFAPLSKYLDGAVDAYNRERGYRNAVLARSAEDVFFKAEALIRQGKINEGLAVMKPLRDRAQFRAGEQRDE